MKKTFLAMTALAAMLFAGCTSSDDLTTRETITKANEAATPINFGTYMGKTGTRTTNGKTGDMTTTTLQASQASGGGFGVFAYYTKSTDYVWGNPGVKPNFMYNQGIFYNNTSTTSTKWEYTPVKYWPNGLDDMQPAVGGDDATLTAGGKVSFFAYAPYVATPTGDQSANDGIIGMTANSTSTEDPKITYKLNTTNFVDLLWGTANNSGETLGGSTQAGATDPTKGLGRVNVNLTKQQVDGNVKFLFKHTLAKVGGPDVSTLKGLQIMTDIDGISGGTDDTNTKVTVSSIEITSDHNADGDFDDPDEAFENKGTLNLATGVWTLSTDAADVEGKKQVIANDTGTGVDYVLANAIKEPTSAPAKTEAGFNGLPTGVTTTAQNVYASTAASPFVFFPGQTPKLTFKITYTVRTKDTNLEDKYTEVVQTVQKKVEFTEPVKLNKMYNIIIHLGLTSVKFEATVDDWSADTDGDGDVDANDQKTVFLPLNVN